jgi:hypothetical protein
MIMSEFSEVYDQLISESSIFNHQSQLFYEFESDNS